jgi:hypothetical protein
MMDGVIGLRQQQLFAGIEGRMSVYSNGMQQVHMQIMWQLSFFYYFDRSCSFLWLQVLLWMLSECQAQWHWIV